MKEVILCVIGISAGGVVSAAVFSFLSSIGIFNRIAGNARCGEYISLFENVLVAGGIAGGLLSIFMIPMPVKTGLGVLYGTATGIFVGCIVMALAETLNSIAVFWGRMRLKKGLKYLVYAIAFGKMTGALIYFLL